MSAIHIRSVSRPLRALSAAVDALCEQNDRLEIECGLLRVQLHQAELAYAELLRVGAVKAREGAE